MDTGAGKLGRDAVRDRFDVFAQRLDGLIPRIPRLAIDDLSQRVKRHAGELGNRLQLASRGVL